MSEENGFVERPTMRSGYYRYDYALILATAENGKAVRVAIPKGGTAARAANAMSMFLKRRGLTAHYLNTKDGYITVWAEKR